MKKSFINLFGGHIVVLFLLMTNACTHASTNTSTKFPDKDEIIKNYDLIKKYSPTEGFNPDTHRIRYEQVSIDEAKNKFPNLALNEKNKYGIVYIGRYYKRPVLGGGALTILCNLETGGIIALSRSR